MMLWIFFYIRLLQLVAIPQESQAERPILKIFINLYLLMMSIAYVDVFAFNIELKMDLNTE